MTSCAATSSGPGHAVLTTGTGAEALRLLDEGRRPTSSCSTSGSRTSTASRCCAPPRSCAIPVIALTARSTVEDRILGSSGARTTTSPSRSARGRSCCAWRAVLGRTTARRAGHGGLSFGGGRLRHRRGATRPHGSTTTDLDLTPDRVGHADRARRGPGRVFSRGELVNRVRGYEFAGLRAHHRLAREEPAPQARADGGAVDRRDGARRRLPPRARP